MVSCNGIFGGIYDEPLSAEDSHYGFVEEDADGKGGLIYLFVNAYDRWTYIDLHHQHIDTLPIDAATPAEWDLALHRYDVRTNEATAAATNFDHLDFVADPATWADLQFVADADSQIVVDISDMINGNLGYAAASVNPVLSHWMDVDISQMPPIYTFNDKAFIVRLQDGSLCALRFENYMNDHNVKGYATIRYRYPLTTEE